MPRKQQTTAKKEFDIREMRLPPHDKDIERSILGILLLHPNSIHTYAKKLSKEFFYVLNNEKVYEAIEHLYDNNQNIDVLTISNRLKVTGDLENIGGTYEIVRYTNDVVSSAHMDTWIAILHDYYLQREGIRVGYELVKDCYDTTNINDVLNGAANSISKSQERIYTNTDRSMLHYLVKLVEERNKVQVDGQIGINTGFRSINRILSGWVNPDLIILAARPAQGKTAFMLNAVHNVLKQNIPVAVFSLEMSGEQLVNRLLSLDSGIRLADLRHNKISDDNKDILSQSENRLSKYPLFIDDTPSLNIRELRSKATILKRKYGIKLLCIDYLQLMSSIDKKANRESEISEISRGCKIIAKELDIPVIALSQLSRAVESRPDKIPQLSDLRESGSIEQDADSVIFLMRPETYSIPEVEIDGMHMPSQGITLVKFAKNRHGSIANVPMKFIGETMKFTDYQN
jgi:replicative DNA helicase